MKNEELIRRIEARLKALNLKDRSASLKAGLHADAIRNIKRGKVPKLDRLKALATALDVPPSYLIDAIDVAGHNDNDQKHTNRPRIVNLDTEDEGLPEGYVAVPTLEIKPGMGGGGYAEDDLMGPPALLPERLIVHDLRGKPLDFLLMEVEGQSMEPVLMSGDQVLIDRRKTNPSQPGIFSLWDGYGLVVKWVERVHDSDPPRLRVMSENKRFSDYEVLAEEARIIGRVVWFARRM